MSWDAVTPTPRSQRMPLVSRPADSGLLKFELRWRNPAISQGGAKENLLTAAALRRILREELV